MMDNNQIIDQMVEDRLRHHRQDITSDKERMMLRIRNVLNIILSLMLRIRNVLNLLFMVLAVVGVVVYIKFDLETGGWIIGTAIVIKTVEVALRLFKV